MLTCDQVHSVISDIDKTCDEPPVMCIQKIESFVLLIVLVLVVEVLIDLFEEFLQAVTV